jgi:hypothetical protein
VAGVDGKRLVISTDLPKFPQGVADLEVTIRKNHISLVIIDPIMSVVHSSLDTHKDREVRQALDPLARFAPPY